MGLKAEDLFDTLKTEAIRPVYFLTGTEAYLRNVALELLLSRAVDESTRDFNLAVFQGGDAEIDHIIGQATSYPMLSERRTVVIRNVNQMDTASTDSIAAYVKNPVSTTLLILEGPALPARSKLSEALKGLKGSVFEFKNLYEKDVSGVMRNGMGKRLMKLLLIS